MNHDAHELAAAIAVWIEDIKRRDLSAFEISAALETGFSVSARMGDVEQIEHHRELACSLTVYKNNRTAAVSISDVSALALKQALDKACSIVTYTECDPCAEIPPHALMAHNYPDLQLAHPWDIQLEQVIQLALHADQVARQADPRIMQTEDASMSSTHYHKIYANSHGFLGQYSGTMHGISVSVVGSENESMERNGDYAYAHNAAILPSADVIAESAVARTVSRLHARKISTRVCPVIFEARAAKSLWSHLISAISGGNVYRRMSFLMDHLGRKIFPDFLSIGQKPHRLCGYGSAPFDQEGVKTTDLDYVREGYLEHYVLSHYSAKKIGMTTTGNAGGVFNLSVTHSAYDLDALCRQMGRGFLITELIGQGINLLTGDYSRGAAGFWIEHGEIQYPVHEVTVAGNLQDMFANIVAVGNDLHPYANIVTGSVWIRQMTVAGH